MLHYYEFGDAQSDQALVVLHGLFGNARNLSGICRHLQSSMRVVAFDLPNHGRSPTIDDMSFSALAAAVVDAMTSLGIDSAHVLGHSLGGKAAMMLALEHPSRVEKLVVADIAPVSYERSHDDVFDAMLSLPSNTQSRAEADTHLSKTLESVMLRQFLLQNLAKQGESYTWRIPLQALAKAYDSIRGAKEFEKFRGQPFVGDALFVRGALSSYVKSVHLSDIAALFPRYRLETVGQAGHWLHAEKPKEFNEIVSFFLEG